MMKKYTALIVPTLGLLALVACNGGAMPVDSKKLLSDMDGPKVQTVDENLSDSAKKAETDGNYKLAAQYYQQMAEKNPDDAAIAFSLAESYRRSGQPDKAILLYDKLIALDPKNISAKESKGLALIAKGDFQGPTPLFEEVLKADPTRWKTLNAFGILFATRNLQAEAQQYFREALKYHPDSASIYNNLGLSQALDRHFDAAVLSLQKASALANSATNERKRIDLNLALVYASAGKLDEAKEMASHYLDGAALDNNLGLYAHLAKDDQMARAYLNMALTESKVYYAKAWDNLQDISSTGNDNAVVTDTAPPPAAPKKPKEKPLPTHPQPTEKVPSDLFPPDAFVPYTPQATAPAVVTQQAPIAVGTPLMAPAADASAPAQQ